MADETALENVSDEERTAAEEIYGDTQWIRERLQVLTTDSASLSAETKTEIQNLRLKLETMDERLKTIQETISLESKPSVLLTSQTQEPTPQLPQVTPEDADAPRVAETVPTSKRKRRII